MYLTVTSYFAVFTAVLLAILLRRRRNGFKHFEKLGVPGPAPHLLWGHYDKFQKNHIYWLEKWAREYGDLYGIFLGSKPFLVSTDVELAQRVLVKDFSNFVNRAPVLELEKSDPNIHRFLSLTEGEVWKKQRSLITPAFTSKNMKEMLPLILKGADDFVTCLGNQKGRFDIVPLVRGLSIDNLGRTVFGIDAGALSGDETTNIHVIIGKISESFMTGTLDLLANSFSTFGQGLSRVLFYLSSYGIIGRADDDLGKVVKNIIKSKKQAQKSNNLLQRLMDASESDERTVSGGKQSLSDEELLSNSVGSFFVGVDTTSIFLSYLFHCLGQHQDVQDRLRKEIMRDGDDELEYYEVSNLKYLDNVINEVLRLYPPATGFNTRVAAQPFSYGKYTFPAGTNILFAVSSIQRDERHWDDPLEFRPERFDARSNNPLAFQPFGDGPRNCVGMRLASMSIKFITARALQKFKFRSYGEAKRLPVSVLSKPGEVFVSVEPL